MPGKIFDLLPDEILRDLSKYLPEGGRFRYPSERSKHNPIYLRDRNRRICIEKTQGKSTREIAKLFNLTKRSIQNILKVNGLNELPQKKKSRYDQLDELLIGGYTKSSIAKKLGISRTRLYQIIKEREGGAE